MMSEISVIIMSVKEEIVNLVSVALTNNLKYCALL